MFNKYKKYLYVGHKDGYPPVMIKEIQMTEGTTPNKRTWPWIVGCLLAVAFTAIGFAGGWLVPRIPQKAYVYLDKIGVVDEIYMVKAGDTLRLQEQYRLRDWPFSMENGDTVVYYPRGLMDTLNRFQPRSRF